MPICKHRAESNKWSTKTLFGHLVTFYGWAYLVINIFGSLQLLFPLNSLVSTPRKLHLLLYSSYRGQISLKISPTVEWKFFKDLPFLGVWVCLLVSNAETTMRERWWYTISGCWRRVLWDKLTFAFSKWRLQRCVVRAPPSISKDKALSTVGETGQMDVKSFNIFCLTSDLTNYVKELMFNVCLQTPLKPSSTSTDLKPIWYFDPILLK